MNILQVDDDPSFLEQAKIFLEKKMNLEVETAVSAKMGLEKMEENEYEAIISDYQMPEVDGLEFLEKVREERDGEIPFIIFTGKGREEVAMEALNLGADRYIQKGGNPRTQFGVLADAVRQEIEHRRIEKESEKSEKKFEAGFDASPNIVFFLDEDGNLEDVNDTALDKLGYSESDIVGNSLSDAPFLSEKAGEVMTEKFTRRVNGEDIPPYPVSMRTASGELVLVEINVGKLEYEGDFHGEVVIARDLTGQKTFNERENLPTEGLSNGIYVLREEGFTFANEALIEMSGYSFQELKNMSFLDLVHPDYEGEVKRWVEKGLSGENSDVPKEVEIKVLPKDGDPIWVKMTQSFVKYGDDYAIVGNVLDITERREAKEKLRESKQSYEELFEKSADALFVHDPDTAEILDVNQKMCEMYDIPRKEVLGMKVEDLASGEEPYTQGKAKKWIQKARTEGPQTFEWRAKKKDGTLFWVEVTLKEAEINGNKRILANVRDISERKEFEEELRESEKKYRTLVERSRDGIYIYRDDDILFANDKICEVSGYSKEEIYNMDIWDLVPPENREEMKEMSEKRFCEKEGNAENTYDTNVLTKDGNVKDAEVSIKKIDYKGKPAALGVVRDVTQRKKREKKLRTMKNSVESSINGIAIGTPDGKLDYANPSFLDMWGYSEESQVLERDVTDFWKDEEKAMKVMEETLKEREWRGKLVAERKDGSTFPVEAAANVVEDEEGNEEAIMSSFKDITKRREAEEREDFLHSLLRHNIRNKSQVVLGYLELMEDSDLTEEMENYLERSVKTLESSINLIEKVRALREVGEEKVDDVSLELAVKDAIRRRESHISESGVDIEKEVGEHEVLAGPLLEELFSNLIDNSVKHSGCEKVRISSKEEGEECIVTVEDDGWGISEEDKEKIFEKGYKVGDSDGSGLGTYLVKEIAESYGGSVEVKDSDMGGARFDVRLKKA